MTGDVVVFGVSAIVLVAGLVQFAKKLGIKDKGSLILAMILGPAIMLGNEAVKQFPIASPWVQALVVGIMVSLTASGLWDGAKQLIGKMQGSAQ